MDDIKREDVNYDETKIEIPEGDHTPGDFPTKEEINTENSAAPVEETVKAASGEGELPREENSSFDNASAGTGSPAADEHVQNAEETVRFGDPENREAATDREKTETVYNGTDYSSGRRYTYNPSGTEDEPSYMRTGTTRNPYPDHGYQQYGQNNESGQTGSGGYGQYGFYGNESANTYSADASNGQQQSSYSQQGNYYGQPTGGRYTGGNSSYGANYGQPAGSGSTQGSSYGQPAGSGNAQGGSYGQPAGSGRAQSGSYGQPAGSGSTQGSSYGRQSGSSAHGERYSNDGYGKGRTGYSSNYDSYRFETPVDPAPINSEDTRYKKKKIHKNKDGSDKKESGGNLKKAGLIAAIAVVFGLVAALVFIAVTSLAGLKVSEPTEKNGSEITAVPTPEVILGNPESDTESEAQSRTAGTYDAAAETPELTVPQVVEQCMPSMVAITNTTIEEYQDFFGGTSQQESVSAGSGIIVGETETELLIATNNHVIQNSKDITVTFIDEAVIPGFVKGMDADNDLAIVAVKLEDIEQTTKDAIRIITIGDSDAMVVGESVVAIGNALGYGQSVSAGIISALNRGVDIDGQSHSLIQTDASINPGNSGGALINMRGELIGINEVKYVDETVEGVGYAIPMATAEPILDSLGSKTARQKVDDDQASYIGIKCIDVPSYYVQAGYPSGVYVSEVTKGGPAEAAGLKEGDIITAIDGISVSSSSQLINYLQYYAAGEVIDFSVSRLNEDNTAFDSSKVPITLGSKKDAGLLDGSNEPDSDSDKEKEDTDEEASSEEAPEEEESSEEGGGFGDFPILPDVENR